MLPRQIGSAKMLPINRMTDEFSNQYVVKNCKERKERYFVLVRQQLENGYLSTVNSRYNINNSIYSNIEFLLFLHCTNNLSNE